jgi:hypothetical protein
MGIQGNSFEFDSTGKPRTLFTRSQWREKGRMVNSANKDAAQTRTTGVTGRTLYLFGIEQTVPDPRIEPVGGKDCGLMPCEIEHGFARDGQKIRPRPDKRKLMARSQWRRLEDRIVVVSNEEAAHTLTAEAGHTVFLFSIEQTREVGAEHIATLGDVFQQLERDAA